MASRVTVVVLKKRPLITEMPTAEHFEVREIEEDPSLENGQVLVKTLYLSVDPYMRCRMREETGADYLGPWQIGEPCDGTGVGLVLKSKYDGLKENDIVEKQNIEEMMWPWKSIVKMDGKALSKIEDKVVKAHPSLALGALGITGLTAYFGIKKNAFIEPQENQTVVISGAAGACGSIAGQIARIEGASIVVGICGTNEKCEHLKADLGFNAAINYKTDNIKSSLKQYCPNGIDVYFDNVGGTISDAVIKEMNRDSHVVLCGQIAVYNTDLPYPPPLSDEINQIIKEKNITRKRYLVLNYHNEYKDALVQLSNWIEEGKLRYKETIVNGIENVGEAFVSVMKGGNIGKQIVKVSDI